MFSSSPDPPSFSGVCTGPSCRGVEEVSLVPPHTPPSRSLYPCLSPLALSYTQRAAIDKGIEIHLEEYVAELETLLRHRDMRGLYKHLKRTVGLGGRIK